MGTLWAAQWHSKNKLDGERQYLVHQDCLPVLFRTRRECREFIREKYGYISERSDLQEEPHGWRMPQPVKVSVIPQK